MDSFGHESSLGANVRKKVEKATSRLGMKWTRFLESLFNVSSGVSQAAKPGNEVLKLLPQQWQNILSPRDTEKVDSSLETPSSQCKECVSTAVCSSWDSSAAAYIGSCQLKILKSCFKLSCSSNYTLLKKLCCKSSGSPDTLSDSRPPTVTHKTLQRPSWINMWKLS